MNLIALALALAQAGSDAPPIGKGKILDNGKMVPVEVKVGEKILFSKFSGTEVKINGEEHLIMREEDVLGIVE